MTFIEVLQDRRLLGQFIRDPETWRVWFTFARAVEGVPPVDGDLETFRLCTGREAWPTEAAAEVWAAAGRRSGKSYVTALLATYIAAFRKHRLSAGEVGHVIVVAPTRQQASIIKRYVSGFFMGNAYLRPMIKKETADGLELSNRVAVTILSGDYRSVRGFSAVCVLVDEVAFFQSEGVSPDAELLRALRPCLATTGGPLICISSPYAKRGTLYQAYRQHFGKEDDPVLVWQGASALLNPTLSTTAIARAKEEDPEGAAAEWDAQFRSDIESFVSREAVEAAVVPGRFELPPMSGISYVGFVDPSGGSADSMTLAVSHHERGRRILDAVRERRPPFSPEQVVEQYAALLKQYSIAVVVGDRYAGEWPREQFRKHGIDYLPSERTKSELYLELLAPLNSGRVELLDHEKLITQLCRLERKVSRSGKDSVDHSPGSRDDISNAVAGALVLTSGDTGPFLPGDVEDYLVDVGHVGIDLMLRTIPGDPGEMM